MMSYLKKFSPGSLLVILLAILTVINPGTGLDLLAFLLIAFIILQKVFGEYFILILLAIRPAMDYWRDYNLFSFGSFDLNINGALSVFLLAWSAYFFIKNRQYFSGIPTKTTWLLFIAWCALTAIYSYDLSSTLRETIKAANLFSLFGICYVMSVKERKKFKEYFLKTALVASATPLAMAVYQFLSKTGVEIDGVANRIYGTFAHPNILATFALVMLAVLINEMFIAKNLKKEGVLLPYEKLTQKLATLFSNKIRETELALHFQIYAVNISLILLLAIIAFTYTRIAWIGVATIFLIVGMVYYKKITLYILAGIALFFILFYPVNKYLIDTYNLNLQSIGLMSRLTSRNEDSDSIKWRADVASKVLPLFKKKFVLGYGYGSFPRVWDDNKDTTNIWDNTSEAHNDYIKIAFESGIIGLILFLIIFLNLLYNQISFALKNRWINIVFIATIASYLIMGLSDNMLHHTPMIWWLWAVWGWWSAEYKLNSKE
jgi:O-antigen ligase